MTVGNALPEESFILTLTSDSVCDYPLCENPIYTGGNSEQCMPCDFLYVNSVQQGFYVFMEAMLDGEQIDSDDWVGAFNGNVCVGNRKWGGCGGDAACDVPVMGDDSSEYTCGYMSTGDIPTFKIYDASENIYIDAFPSEEIAWEDTGTFSPIIESLIGVSCTSGEYDCAGICDGDATIDACGICDGSGPDIMCYDSSMVCDASDCFSHFKVGIEETGESTLFIFEPSIIGLDAGDEVGLFDTQGIIDDSGTTGEILVGAGIWTGNQLEVTAIGSADLSDFGGPILPGYIAENTMTLKVWDGSSEYDATYTTSFGSGSFNGLFTNIDSIDFNGD